MIFAVTDKTGAVLGLYRMPDATYFSFGVAVAKPLMDHLDDFASALKAKGNTLRHVELVTGRARRCPSA